MKLIPTAAANGKVLVPLATMLAAGAVAIGSGASFSSTSVHTATVTSGILHHANTKDGATLAISKIQPNQTQTGTLTITNDGNLDSNFTLTPTNATDSFVAGTLNLTITETLNGQAKSAPVYTGDFAGLSKLSAPIVTEPLKVGDVATFTYTVALNSDAPNTDQNQSAGARFTYVTTQAAGNVNTTFNGPTPSAVPSPVSAPTP